MHSAEQRQVIATIGRLFAKREPLNVTAVKRRHPELIAKAYTIQPFWGWTRALEAAGLTYSAINIEILDYCTCQICWAEVDYLTSHLLHKHDVSTDDYRRDFPGAEFVSERFRASRSRMSTNLLRVTVWEPLWSAEHVRDRIFEYHRRRFPINARWMRDHDSGLLAAACNYFSTWTGALYATGFDAEEIEAKLTIKLERYPGREEVLEGISERATLGRTMSVNVTYKENAGLVLGARRYFGNWDKALEAAGFDPVAIRKSARSWHLQRTRYPSAESVIEAIGQHASAGRSLNMATASKQNGALVRAARKFFSNWSEAISLAGFDSAKIKKQGYSWVRPNYPPDLVLERINQRLRRGLSLIEKHTRQDDSRLVYSAKKHFGGWDKALKVVGIDYAPRRAKRITDRKRPI